MCSSTNAVGGLAFGHVGLSNTTHGSGWFVHFQATNARAPVSWNTTHGSGWIVHFQPTPTGHDLLGILPTTRMLADQERSFRRQHLNDPPTAVGGISGNPRVRL